MENVAANIYTKNNPKGGKQFIYSVCKDVSGVKLMGALLTHCGLKVGYFTGDLTSSQRTQLLLDFNSDANMYGEKIQVLLGTKSSAEGLTLLGVKHVHILESDPRELHLNQVIGRAMRYASHHKMPKEHRTVTVWRYFATAVDTDGQPVLHKSIDYILYYKGRVQLKNMTVIYNALRDSSIEAENGKVFDDKKSKLNLDIDVGDVIKTQFRTS